LTVRFLTFQKLPRIFMHKKPGVKDFEYEGNKS
jgi:hypothetical protein